MYILKGLACVEALPVSGSIKVDAATKEAHTSAARCRLLIGGWMHAFTGLHIRGHANVQVLPGGMLRGSRLAEQRVMLASQHPAGKHTEVVLEPPGAAR